MQKPLAQKFAVITGASSGIGYATAVAFAQAGAELLVTARRKDALARLGAEVEQRGGALRSIAGDLADRGFVSDLASAAAQADILVSNAGTLTYAPLLDLQIEECEAMFRVNVLATLQLCQEIGRNMLARGSGHMIVVTSGAAREVFPFGSVYAATKHALTALTQAMRLEWEPHGVKVTEIAPGMIETEIRDRITHPAVLASLKARKVQPVTAADVADTILFAATASSNTSISLLDVRPRLRAT